MLASAAMPMVDMATADLVMMAAMLAVGAMKAPTTVTTLVATLVAEVGKGAQHTSSVGAHT